MSFTINSQPNILEPAYQNTIPFVVTSTNNSLQNFRYLFDFYTGPTYSSVDNFQTRLSTYPRTSGECVVSAHYVVRDNVTYNVTPFIENTVQATQSITYYRISFGEQYNPGLTFGDTAFVGGQLGFVFESSVDIIPGDILRIDKDDKSVNINYDGTCSVTATQSGGTVGGDPSAGVMTVVTDKSFGSSTSIEPGSVIDLTRFNLDNTATFSAYNGTRQYDELNYDFTENYVLLEGGSLVNHIENGTFDNQQDWIVSDYLSTTTIGGGVLNYYDGTSGAGIAVIRQNDVLTPGVFYTVTLETSNNNETSALVGDDIFFGVSIFSAYDNGVQTASFTASGTDFILELSTQNSPAGVDIDNLTVTSDERVYPKFLSSYVGGKPIYYSEGNYGEYETLSFMLGATANTQWSNVSVEMRTYDSSDTLITTQNEYLPDSFKSGVPRYDVGVGTLNEPNLFSDSVSYYTVEVVGDLSTNVIQNGDFSSTDYWIISNSIGTASITGGELTYFDSTDAGISTITQNDVLVPGIYYTVTLETSNNNTVGGVVGDDIFFGETIFTSFDNGVQTASFTASGTDFILELSSNGVPSGVDIDNLSVIATGLTTSFSETKRYNIVQQCREYDLIRLCFLNKLGGVDYWTFNLVSKYSSKIKREMIERYLQYNYQIGDRGREVINQKITEEWSINTDYLSDEQALFIRELVESPEVYMIDGDNLLPIVITDNKYDFKSTLNDELIQYKLKFMKAYDIISNV